MLRSPVVAGQFYPGDQSSLSRTLASLIPDVPVTEKKEALAVVSPHAGYVYSGGVAGETFAMVKVPETVLILGPNHTGSGLPVAIMDQGAWGRHILLCLKSTLMMETGERVFMFLKWMPGIQGQEAGTQT